jgi:hypothetical protein
LRRGLLLIALAFAWFALSSAPNAFGVSPAPDGGYPGGNTAEGDSALFSLTTGTGNTAAGNSALFSNTDGHDNTATGWQALVSNTTGSENTATGSEALTDNRTLILYTATGFGALAHNTSGSNNTATGVGALFSNTTVGENTANGYAALNQNTTGGNNTATGFNALLNNTTGSDNTAIGDNALLNNTTGGGNTAAGVGALQDNTGDDNTAIGLFALFNNQTAQGNTATGSEALIDNRTGIVNTATGFGALSHNTTGASNTADGFNSLALSSGSNNIALGANAGVNLTTGSYNIDIGNPGVAGESSTIRVGTQGMQMATFIAGIYGAASFPGLEVYVNSNGQLGTRTSSARFKDEIKPMDKASEVILALQPVTFRYKKEIDPNGIPQFGLVAEEVEKVNRDLVVHDAQDKPFTVRYEAVNAMLLNEFLKEHRKVEQQEATITQLKKDFQAAAAHQQEQIEALTAGLQRVSAQVEMSRPASQMAGNDR